MDRRCDDAPAAEAFPAYPPSWYHFGDARALRRGPMAKDMLGRRIVVFRTESGALRAMDATCAHLGADLSRGCVVGESIRCPYHGWEFGAEGRCTRIPGASVPHEAARQRVFAVAERHDALFLFNGATPLFPLPFFLDEDPDDFVAGRPFRFTARCSWYLLASHSFDSQHFAAVHDRALLAPAEVDCPAPYARRNRYSARVTGTGVFDRVLRRTAGSTVDISITTWGGTLFFLTGTFARAASCFMLAARPEGPDSCAVEGICFARRGSALAAATTVPVILAARRLFTRGYLLHEAELLGSPRYQPWALTAVDRDLIDYFRWQAALTPQRQGATAAPAGTARVADSAAADSNRA